MLSQLLCAVNPQQHSRSQSCSTQLCGQICESAAEITVLQRFIYCNHSMCLCRTVTNPDADVSVQLEESFMQALWRIELQLIQFSVCY